MDNDLFTATETLNSAFREILKKENKASKWSIREHYKHLRQALTHRGLTVSEKLLLCYGNEEELFSSRDGKKQQIQETHKKRQDVFKEFHKLLTEFCELPEEEQERIRKELGFTGPSSVAKPQKDNTTTAFEHNKNKGKKNGK